jgi:hypothetical protein
VNDNIKGGKIAVPLRLHGELNALMDTSAGTLMKTSYDSSAMY